jgi:signal transduction histidine kinase
LHDITERRRAEEERVRLSREQAARAEAEAAQRHLAFLAEASTILAGSLDYQTTLTSAARQAVPYLADCCAVDIAGENGVARRMAAAHRDPAKSVLILQLGQRYPTPVGPEHGFPRVLRTGRSDFWPVIDDAQLAAAAGSPEHRALLHRLGYRSLICAPLLARGRIIGAITFAMADSGRQYTPVDLALAEDLAQRIAMAVDNARLYQAAQDAVRMRDEFLSIASHELKTPLTSLQLAVQSLLRNMRRGGPPDQEKAASRLLIVEGQSKRLAGLINDLLDISRISAGRLALEPEATDLAALTRQVIGRFQDELEAAGCALALHADTPTRGHWDPLRIEQVITNLLTNAMKYGQGRPIEVTVQPDGGVARLTVRDGGIGIAPDHLERIFGRFERAVAPGRFGGMGLGLYITRQIVEAHGGTIRVISAPAHGAIFTVELPL